MLFGLSGVGFFWCACMLAVAGSGANHGALLVWATQAECIIIIMLPNQAIASTPSECRDGTW
jgi:hypothetical protein